MNEPLEDLQQELTQLNQILWFQEWFNGQGV